MIITKEQIKALNPCKDGWEYYLKNQESDLLLFLLKVNSDETAVDEDGYFQGSNWAKWLFTNLMTREQCVEIAIFSANQVIDLYESKYPGDDRPRTAIKTAQKCLENKVHSYAAANAAYAADAAARAAYAAYAADAAAYDKKELQEKIIREAVIILERDQ